MVVAVATLLSSPVIAQNDDLSGPAWDFADRAYKAYDAKEYQQAVAAAREAVVLRPDLARLRTLLVNSLAAAGDIKGATTAADEAIAAGVANDELRNIRDRLQAQVVPQTTVTAPIDAAHQAAAEQLSAFDPRNCCRVEPSSGGAMRVQNASTTQDHEHESVLICINEAPATLA